MKKFIINCDFGGQIAPFAVYIGTPEGGHHPLHFQADWLSKQRGGTIPPDVMDAVSKLKDLADKNKVSLEELCVYALGAAQQEKDANGGEQPDEEVEATTEAPTESVIKDEGDLLDFDDLVLEDDDSDSDDIDLSEDYEEDDDDDITLSEDSELEEAPTDGAEGAAVQEEVVNAEAPVEQFSDIVPEDKANSKVLAEDIGTEKLEDKKKPSES